ncbi:MAG: family 20 glycosylhydrolase, partial [Bacteroidales bacterium]|nr:family 20 glycosylhydrolase [Bacteroidales bacterium]
HHSILQVPYDYNPVPAELTAEEAKHILGVQGNLWSEYIYSDYMRDYLTFPKMFAVAETAWTPPAPGWTPRAWPIICRFRSSRADPAARLPLKTRPFWSSLPPVL